MGQSGGRGMKGVAQFCGNGAQRLFSLFSLSDVIEEDCDVPLLGPAESERVDVIVPAEGMGRTLKPPRLPGQSNLAVNLEPVLLVRWGDLPHPPSNGVLDAGLLLKDRIDVEKAVVNRLVRVIEQDLDHAETLVDRIKQSAVLLLGLAHLPVGVFERSDPLFGETCQIDDDYPINGEQERLEGCLNNGITCAHRECVGAERHAEQYSANRGPNACKQAGRQNCPEEQHEWSTCSGQPDKPYPEGKHTRHRGDAEEIPKYGVLQQDVDATRHPSHCRT